MSRTRIPSGRSLGIATAALIAAGVLVAPATVAHAAATAANDEYTVSSGFTFLTEFGKGVLANDAGADQTHSLTIITPAAHGGAKAIGAGGTFRYRPADGYVGDDSFNYCVSATPQGGVCLSNIATVTIHVKPTFERLAGVDRYAGAVEVSKRTFETAMTVYIASGEVYADALSASAVAGAQGSPVLLMTKSSLPGFVADEINRLDPDRIVIVGGENTIDAQAMAGLRPYANVSVERVTGLDRYAVSAKLSSTTVGEKPSAVYLASGEVFPDALSAGPAAGHKFGPVLLVQKGGIPAAVAAELARLKPTKVVVLGGSNTVSDAVISDVGKSIPGTPVTRVSGVDRYEVSAATSAQEFVAPVPKTVYVASGATFPDALAGAPAAIHDGAPMLLVGPAGVSAAVDTELKRLAPTRIVVLGGINTISEQVAAQLRGYLPAG